MFDVIWYGGPASEAHQSVIKVYLVQAFLALIVEHVASGVAVCAVLPVLLPGENGCVSQF